MGTSRSVSELAGKLTRAGDAIDGAAKDGVSKAALLVKTSVLAQLQAAGVRNGRLRGVGAKGARIGVRYDVRGTKNPTALVRATGPFHLIERTTQPHEITPKGKKKQALSIPGIGPRARANHPGSPGRHPWRLGVQAAVPKVPPVMMAEQVRSLRRFFG